jgi:DNA-binding transcriptional regulator YiaG
MTKLPTAATSLREYLREHRVSQGRFAIVTLGTANSTLQDWLSGRGKPSLVNALKIEQVTGIPVSAWFVVQEEGDHG